MTGETVRDDLGGKLTDEAIRPTYGEPEEGYLIFTIPAGEEVQFLGV